MVVSGRETVRKWVAMRWGMIMRMPLDIVREMKQEQQQQQQQHEREWHRICKYLM